MKRLCESHLFTYIVNRNQSNFYLVVDRYGVYAWAFDVWVENGKIAKVILWLLLQ